MADPDPAPAAEAPASTPSLARAKTKPKTGKPKVAAATKPTQEEEPKVASPPKEASGKPPVESPKAAPAQAPAAPAKKSIPEPSKTVVDVTGLVLGRASSYIAQRLLKGEHIVVVNAEQCVITGSRASVLETYRAHRARGSKRTGPHFPRYPDRIFRRTVRGMLPHLKTRGKEALDRLEVHIGVPPEYQGQPAQTIDDARARPALRPPITLGEVTHNLGAPW